MTLPVLRRVPVSPPAPSRAQRAFTKAALRQARLGLLSAASTARTHPDAITRADARTSQADWALLLDYLRSHAL